MSDQEHSLHAMVLAQLDEIEDPCSVASGTPMGLVEMGLVDSVNVSAGGLVEVNLRLTSPLCHMIGFFKVEAVRRLASLAGVTGVALHADMGLDWSSDRMSAVAQGRRAQRVRRLERLRESGTMSQAIDPG